MKIMKNSEGVFSIFSNSFFYGSLDSRWLLKVIEARNMIV